VRQRFPINHSCVARRLANTPFLLEVTRCLPLIPGESRDSGHDSSLDAKAKLAVFSACPERFLGESLERVPDSRSGLIMGDFPRDFEG
jgi:hypothetical protein